MFIKRVASFLLLIGLVGCGTVEQEYKGVKSQVGNIEEDSGVNTSSPKTGKQLYQVCAGCHGQQGEKEALGKSQLIGGQAYATTKYQLEEYKAGRLDQYGMGELMKGEAQLDLDEIKLLSKYIERLSVSSNSISTNTTPTVSEKDIFFKCKGCHGEKGEKHALGKSYIIRDMSKLEIYNALAGYQNGTYGRGIKAIMKGQVNGLSKSDLKDLAQYIDDL